MNTPKYVHNTVLRVEFRVYGGKKADCDAFIDELQSMIGKLSNQRKRQKRHKVRLFWVTTSLEQ